MISASLCLPAPRTVTQMVYRGLRLYVTAKYRDGLLRKLVYSYRMPRSCDRRHRKDYGVVMYEREYNPAYGVLLKGVPIPEELIHATLDKVFDARFFPGLVEAVPDLVSPATRFDLLAPYALMRVQRMLGRASSTNANEKMLMDRMTALWADWPICDIMPARCATDLLDMDYTPATGCKRLLALLTRTELAHLVPDKDAWSRYALHMRPRRASLPTQVRRQLIHVPLDTGQICEVLRDCDKKIDGPEGDRYLATAIMLLTGVEPEELCALQLRSVSPMQGYPSFYGVWIDREIIKAGRRKKNDDYQRAARHEIRDIEDPVRCRIIPVGHYLYDLIQRHLASRVGVAAGQEAYLIINRRNTTQVCWPETLTRWVEETFSAIVAPRQIDLAEINLTAKYSVVDYLIVTASKKLEQEGRYAEEELRALFGRPPRAGHTDVRSYADLQSPTALVRMADMQDCWVWSVLGASDDRSNATRKLFRSPGMPHQLTRMRMRITIPPEAEVDKDICIRLQARFGFRYIQYDNQGGGAADDAAPPPSII